MAHVVIRAGSATTNGLLMQLIVDGLDITKSTAAEGFAVEFGDSCEHRPAVVTIPVVTDALEIDLPDAVVEALRPDREEVA